MAKTNEDFSRMLDSGSASLRKDGTKQALSGIEEREIAFSDMASEAKTGKLENLTGTARREELTRPETGLISPELAGKWAALDAQAYGVIKNTDAKNYAADLISQNMAMNADYRVYMERNTPTIAQAAQDSTEKLDSDIETKEARKGNLSPTKADLHTSAEKNLARNLDALRKIPGMEERSGTDLNKLAYWRGIVAEHNQGDAGKQAATLARFDAKATDPSFLSTLETQTKLEKTTDHAATQSRHTEEEQSL